MLKAGLAQYGLRDWERVASMLTKKTAAQCRERWEAYLDPRLHIHEAWSLEEEEKLVELQSLFPNQWRRIAEQLTKSTSSRFNRPPWLCEQRYLELRDEQDLYLKQKQQRQDGSSDATDQQTLDAFMAERRRRRMAAKSHQERAPRADTTSGELLDKEMIAMATSRLANQDQKKGLRKERQRQLEEATFMATLESNREGIESGTLSLRQEKRMKKAMEEDRQSSAVVDEIVEQGDSSVDDATSASDDDTFEAIDMNEDQKQAGLVKRQRTLMKDLTAQTKRLGGQASSSLVGAYGGPTMGSITGVNQDLLQQLTMAPTSSTQTIAPPLTSHRSAADGTPVRYGETTMVAPSVPTDLSQLFAALPMAATAPPLSVPTTTVPSSPTHSSLSSGPVEKQGGRSTAALDAPGFRAAATTSTESSLHNKTQKSFIDAHVKEVVRQVAPARSPSLETMQREAEPPLKKRKDAPMSTSTGVTECAISTSRQERQTPFLFHSTKGIAYLQLARQMVEIDCERHHLLRSHVAPLSAAELKTAGDMVDAEIVLWNTEHQQKQPRHDDGTTTADVAKTLLLEVEKYTKSPDYWQQVGGVPVAVQSLETLVVAQVDEANRRLAAAQQEMERVMGVSFMDEKVPHVLCGYLDEVGGLKGASSSASTSSSANATSAGTVADYVYSSLVSKQERLSQQVRFLESLREEEQQGMQQELDGACHKLKQLRAREHVLQEMYRQHRAAVGNGRK